MKAKTLGLVFLANFIFYVRANNENLSILNETSFNHTIKQIESKKPIVIHTQLKNYDQPTLKEYQECHENLEKCKKVCGDVKDPNQCVQKCPVCPLLIKQKLVVQGINDTSISQATTTSINTTNIIRLTNEIRNIIETHQGNITNLNENVVNVQQNISTVGGKFGLGFNNTDPCCIILSSQRNCGTNRCHRKRHRVCGSKCKSRVMTAKRVTICENPVSDLSNEEFSERNCYETIKYIPHNSHRKEKIRSRKRCSFSPDWPYVSCSENGGNYERLICKSCLSIPYFYILQKGIPPHCTSCFMTYASSMSEIYPQFWHSIFTPDIQNYDYFSNDKIVWQQDGKKCKLPDGTISDKCEVESSNLSPTNFDPFRMFQEAQDDYLEYDNYEDTSILGFENNLRKRRHTFLRSKYSIRYR